MSILKKLQEQGSLLSEHDGNTPPTINVANSKLHYSYSINGEPLMPGKPKPSMLDLNGKTPVKYLSNPPK